MQNFWNVNFDRVGTVLGKIVSKKEISVDPAKIEAVSNWERLRTQQNWKVFLD